MSEDVVKYFTGSYLMFDFGLSFTFRGLSERAVHSAHGKLQDI